MNGKEVLRIRQMGLIRDVLLEFSQALMVDIPLHFHGYQKAL